jgi:L-asparagine transporter-like permease
MENYEEKSGKKVGFMAGWGFILLIILIVIASTAGSKTPVQFIKH